MNKQCIGPMVIAIALAGMITSCTAVKETKSAGSIEKLDPALDQLISTDAKIEVLGTGYTWSEGPLWVESQKMLLFSDVPQDTVYKWTEAKGVEVYLTPSGYTGTGPANSREQGSNGLTLNTKGELVLTMCGDRRIAIMNAPLDHPEPKYTTVADHFNGKRFNSPNDVVQDKQGNFYFTDPPYGFKMFDKDPAKEIAFNGVYKIFPNGKVIALVDTLTKPNGIALSPDQKSLYIANSDGDRARWYKFELGDSGVVSGKVFFDISKIGKEEKKGGPDGMKVDSKGNLWASGPSGIWIFSPDAKPIGRIKLENNTANCALSSDEKTLFITSHSQLLRVALK